LITEYYYKLYCEFELDSIHYKDFVKDYDVVNYIKNIFNHKHKTCSKVVENKLIRLERFLWWNKFLLSSEIDCIHDNVVKEFAFSVYKATNLKLNIKHCWYEEKYRIGFENFVKDIYPLFEYDWNIWE